MYVQDAASQTTFQITDELEGFEISPEEKNGRLRCSPCHIRGKNK